MHIIFHKNDEFVELDGGTLKLNLNISEERSDALTMATFPSLNVNFYAEKEEDFDQAAEDSLTTFFKYWYKEKGEGSLIQQLLQLGFSATMNQSNGQFVTIQSDKIGNRRFKNDHLELV